MINFFSFFAMAKPADTSCHTGSWETAGEAVFFAAGFPVLWGTCLAACVFEGVLRLEGVVLPFAERVVSDPAEGVFDPDFAEPSVETFDRKPFVDLAPESVALVAFADAPLVAFAGAPLVAFDDASLLAFTDAPLLAFTDAPLLDFTDAPLLAFADAPLLAFTDASLLDFTDAPLLAFTDAPLLAFTDASLLDFTDAPLLAFADAPLLAFADAPVVVPVTPDEEVVVVVVLTTLDSCAHAGTPEPMQIKENTNAKDNVQPENLISTSKQRHRPTMNKSY